MQTVGDWEVLAGAGCAEVWDSSVGSVLEGAPWVLFFFLSEPALWLESQEEVGQAKRGKEGTRGPCVCAAY